MVRIAAILITLAVTPAVAQDQPWVGYTVDGLQETRKPWQFNWERPDMEWLWVSTDSQNAKWLIQLASDIKAHAQPKTYRKVWIKIDYSGAKTTPIVEAKLLISFNCVADTFTNESMIFYSKDGSAQNEGRSATQQIVPETMAATVSRRVCAQ